MSFFCPQCLNPGSLEIIYSMQFPADSVSDDIMLQMVGCRICEFKGLAVYQESRRGALDSDVWDHTGYCVVEADLNAIVEAMRTCPEPMNSYCTCPAHQKLGQKDIRGRWLGLSEIRQPRTFRMHLVL